MLLKLAPTPDDHAALRSCAPWSAFNAACNASAVVALRAHSASTIDLQQLVYYGIRQRFGLSAQRTIRAIANVAQARQARQAPPAALPSARRTGL